VLGGSVAGARLQGLDDRVKGKRQKRLPVFAVTGPTRPTSCLNSDQETSCASSQSSRMIYIRNGARNRTAFAGSFRFSQLLRLRLGITLLPKRSRCLILSCFMIRLLNRSNPVGNSFGSGPT